MNKRMLIATGAISIVAAEIGYLLGNLNNDKKSSETSTEPSVESKTNLKQDIQTVPADSTNTATSSTV